MASPPARQRHGQHCGAASPQKEARTERVPPGSNVQKKVSGIASVASVVDGFKQFISKGFFVDAMIIRWGYFSSRDAAPDDHNSTK